MANRSRAQKHYSSHRKNRASRRHLLLQQLDRRELLAADAPMPVWAPGTPQSEVDDYFRNLPRTNPNGASDPILQGSRWTNPVGGPSPNLGDPAIVTWSIVPDGTTTVTINGGAGAGSNLIARFDSIYGDGGTNIVADKPWFPLIERAYQDWSNTSGVFFIYEPNDDGAAMANANRGVQGVRGDVRIGGANIDGNSGILAFNFYPNNGGNSGLDGDMLIDTNDNFYVNNAEAPSGENRGLVNVATHEAGHGIGIAHSIPIDGTKLMEPFINLGFYGAQLDDIISANILYGDRFELEEQNNGFIDLGVLPKGTRGVFDLSIDESADVDLFRFEVNGPRILSTIAQPIGDEYLVGPQGGTPSLTNTLRYSNLRLRVLADDQTTVIAEQDLGALGEAEILSDLILPQGGTYFIEVAGTGSQTQLYEFQVLLEGFNTVDPTETAPRLISINPNAGEIFDLEANNLLHVSPNELIFRFDGGQRLDAATLEGIRITRSGGDGTFNDGNEEIIEPGFLGFGESERIVISRFANPLPDDQYKIEIFGFDLPGVGIVGLRNIDGQLFRPEDINADREEVFFEVEIGALVTAVVPQPVEMVAGQWEQRRNIVHVYFNDDPLSDPANGIIATGDASAPSVVDPQFYNLYATKNTVENTDDDVLQPTRVVYDPSLNRAVLEFPMDLSEWGPILATNEAGTLRLRIGSNDPIPTPPTSVSVSADETLANAPGDAFVTARPLAADFNGAGQSVVIDSVINPVTEYLLQWPGSGDEPGVRSIRPNSQTVSRADTQLGISTLFYNFKQQYGEDIQNNVLDNAITEAQKQRVREVFDLYEQFLGVRFVESADRGLQIVTGDMRAIDFTAEVEVGGNLSIYRSSDLDPGVGLLIIDGAENWYDGYGQSPDNRPSWFLEALRQVGSLLGIGDLFDRPPGTAAGSEAELAFNLLTEPDFLSQSDITLGQYLFRPESRDIDLYSFSVGQAGRLTAETFAERLANASLLNTSLTLWKKIPGGAADEFELIARNDDFYSNDSFIGIDLEAGEYVVGVSAAGNDNYNPKVENSGMGGTSEGRYQLRLVYTAAVTNAITDADGTPLDGDADGLAGGDYNFWFRTAREYDGSVPLSTTVPPAKPRVLFVSKLGTDTNTSGTRQQPLRTVDQAMRFAFPGDVIRILPNAGNDGRYDTLGDNRAYEIGLGGVSNLELTDGLNLEVKRGVTVMVDAGSIFKMRGSEISVGSSSIDTDRSLGALQVLGTPHLIDATGTVITDSQGRPVPGTVIFTSYDDQNVGVDTNPLQTTPGAGHWGGISFRNDVDYAQGRPVAETEGIFVNYVGFADIRYGGGAVGSAAVSPIQLNEARPTIQYSIFRDSADAAMSADPNSFEESNFHAPIFQTAASFTSDYDRVGPDLRGNQFENNSINGLFIRIDTPTAGQLEPMTVSGRFDDRDVTHVLSQQLILQGTPGGPLLQTVRPSVLSVTVNAVAPTATDPTPTLAAGTYDYRLTFVDIDGSESLASLPSRSVTVAAGQQVRLASIPTAPNDFVGRRLYRLDPTGDYVFVAQLNKSQQSFIDNGATRGGVLDTNLAESLRARYDARLSIDPGVVMKIQTSRIEATFGADFYAEGVDGRPVIFTSRQDDRYGAGGTFDTNNDGSPDDGGAAPQSGDWAGLIFGQSSSGSLDYSLLTFAGGNAAIEGSFANFNPVEIVQAKVRIANSTFEDNADGQEADPIRSGRGFNDAAAVFVRGAQPVIIGNIFRDNGGAAISINPDALNFYNVSDWGRGTGGADQEIGYKDNQGPLIRANKLTGNGTNGLRIRPEVMTTEGVWDDTDIVHVVGGDVVVTDHHYVGGLLLESSPNQSLVVKFESGARLLATGRPLDINDRIGGTLQVVGQPGFPVILTSILDDSVGAGFTPDGRAQTDTNGRSGVPQPGDWQGIVLDVFANDRNVEVILENEPALATAAEFNAIPGAAQFIGALAASEKSGDENERLGFSISGTLSDDSDVDVYSFMAQGGTEVWIDLDRTTYSLDSVVELIDQNGKILVLSDNTHMEESAPAGIFRDASIGDLAFSLSKNGGLGQSESPNEHDAGFRVVLPGAQGEDAIYFVRVRSSNVGPMDSTAKLLDPNAVRDGLSQGAYKLAIRLREVDEVAGSIVQFADIRFAVNGIDLVSAPLHSPLAGEAAESLVLENGVLVDTNNAALTGPLGGAEFLGNLLSTDRAALSITGFIGNQSVVLNPGQLPGQDFDAFTFDVVYDSLETEIANPDARYVPVTFDIDYADGLGRVNTSISVYDAAGRLILTGRDSNIAGDMSTPLRGVDSTNLAAGSAGVLDAHIGPVELPEGRYTVIVHSDVIMPNVFDQFVNPNTQFPNVRVVPANAARQIASDGVDEHLVPPLFPLPNVQVLDYPAEQAQLEFAFDTDAIVPYSLEDVNLFVALAQGINGGTEQTTIAIFDPFTGTFERTIGEVGQPIADFDFRADGELYAYTTGPQTGGRENANTGNYINISTRNAAVLSNSDDGITFRRNNQAGDNTEADDGAQLIVNAMTYNRVVSTRAWVVGNRDNTGRFGEITLARNLLYWADPTTGEILNFPGGPDRDFPQTPYIEGFGGASQKVEVGIINTGTYGGPGERGNVVGIAIDPESPQFIYAVDDRGGVYLVDLNGPRQILNLGSPGQYTRGLETTYLGTIAGDPAHTLGILRFSGLSLGPLTTEGGRFTQTLFATTSDGWMYSFGVNKDVINPFVFDLHPFVNGQRAIRMRYPDGTPAPVAPVGLTFSTLEDNPWHQTNDRSANPGHGLVQPYDNSRPSTTGGNSMYFGFEPGAPDENTIELPENDARGTLAPGGAHGSLMTQPFSLAGYSEADKPTVYFSYFLETEGRDYSPTQSMLDSFRVFASGDDGVWRLMATNDTYRNPEDIDEYDYFTETGIPVQELFDNTNNWRQARIDLSPLAGHRNIRVRLDFATAGGMNFANFPGYRTEIMAVPGNELTDGDTLLLRDSLNPFAPPVVFEVDLGFVIEVPLGSEITVGDSFDVTFGGNTQTVTFTNGPAGLGQASINANMTSREVADAVFAALDPGINAVRFSEASIGLTGATNFVNNAVGSAVEVVSVPGIDPTSNVAIRVEGNLTRNQVADRIREALVVAFGDPNATIENYRSFGDRVVVHQFTLVDAGPFGGITGMPGDEFGGFESARINNVNVDPGSNNEVEGVYIDDFIIGFAERGEMVLGAPINTGFRSNPESDPAAVQPERPFEIVTGGYNLEIRTSTEFGVPDDPALLQLNEDLGLGRSFDTNDRLAGAVTIVAQGGGELRDGDTFVLSDGTRQMTFEFDSVVTPGVQPGRVAVSFDPRRDLPTDVAASIRDAINSQQVQLVLDIRAESGDSFEVGATTSNRIELFGETIFVNPSPGRNLKVDLFSAENFRDRVAAETRPVVNTPNVVEYVLETDTFARALPVDYINGATDTLFATGKIGDRATSGTGNEILLTDDPRNDVDTIKIHLFAGNTIDIDIDAVTTSRRAQQLTLPLLLVHDLDGNELASSIDPGASATAPGESVGEAFIRFTAPASGYYFISVASQIDPVTLLPLTFGDYQLIVRPASDRNDVLYVDHHMDIGDENRFRDQGQILIESNFISDSSQWGVRATASARDRNDVSDLAGRLLPKPGSARLLRNENTARLLPGSVISNNVILAGGSGGVLFAGDPSPLGSIPGSVPFGRIVNNTIVGNPAAGDIGIDVGVNASPTVINNIVSGFTTGLRVAANVSSQTTIVGGNIYRDNTSASNFPLGNSSFNLDLPAFPNKALFADAPNRIFIPANGSLAIDSSFASLSDRQLFFDTVKNPSGIGLSPIVAPSIDAYGQPRVDDPAVQTPAGVGANVFIDRGAVDRADFVGPIASIAVPTDFIEGQGDQLIGGDSDGTPTFLKVPTETLAFFEIQLLEPMGSGPNTETVLSQSVVLTENGRRMVEGIDYVFGYSASSNTIRLTPLSGIWRPDAAYEITLNNRDRLVVQAPRGDQITDGDQLVITDDTGVRAFLEFDTGYVLDVPQTLTLVVPFGEGGADGFRDGDQFEIRAAGGISELFELNVFGDVSSGVTEIPVAPASSATQIRDAILAVLQTRAAGLNIAPVAVGTNQIHLGSRAGHFVDTLASPLAVIGVNRGVSDGDTFTYRSGTTELQFEFNLEGNTTTDIESNVIITFRREDTYLELAEKIADAFQDTDFDLNNPRALGDGTVHIGGLIGDTLNTDNTAVTQRGTPGVTDSLVMTVNANASAFNEGDQFAIINAGVTTVFELGFDRDIQPGAVPIRLVAGDTAEEIAAKIVGAIINATIGLTPTDEGNGEIRLNEPFGYELNLLTFAGDPAAAITATGVPGGAVRVPIIPSPSLSPDGVAGQIVGALRSTPLTSQVFTPGGGSMWFARTSSIVGLDSIANDAIRDLAGNALQPNRANAETQFTILMPNARLDFGDAPNSYNTLNDDNGARNTLGNRGLPRLGLLIDTEADALAGTSDDAGDLAVTIGGGAGAIGAPVASIDLENAFVLALNSPTAGDEGLQVILQTGGQLFVYELDSDESVADPSFIPVAFTPGISAAALSELLAETISTTNSRVGARAQGTNILIYGGDEDGVPVGSFQANSSVANVTGLFFDVEGNFLSFLNPADAAVDAAVITTGGGLLDAWIDFNQDGRFDGPGEQVLFNEPVLDGVNRVQIATPSTAGEGLTWARFRLSRTGNQSPDGVAISGEVEDYQVRVARVTPPTLHNDTYTVDEDTTLATGGAIPTVLDNDQLAALAPSSVMVMLESDVRFGTLTLNTDGSFAYVPDGNYYGADSFTYRIFGLAELEPGNPAAGLLPVRSTQVGTVAITVNPINDVPRAVDKQRTVLEDLPAGLVITAAELLVDALPNDLTVVTEPPWDESDQSLRITAIGDGTTSVSAPTGVGSESASIVTGQGITVVANFLDGALVDVVYFPSNNYNQDNPLNPADPLPSLDIFTFTVTDDGRTVYLDGTEITPLPEESVIGTVTVTVDPVNDPPEFDFIAEHTVAEDSGLVTLLAADNLLPGPANAFDEFGQTVTFTLVPDPSNRTGLFTVQPTIDSDGMLSFQSAPHQVGTVVYTVTAMDNGPDDALIGDDPVADPVQLTITISQVNDAPEFTGVGSIDVLEDQGPYTVQYATGVRPGPVEATDEADEQEVRFEVTPAPGNPTGLLLGLPTIDPAGVMRFSSSQNAVGTAVFIVTLIDDGGTLNPGDVDTSLPQTVTINVRPVNDVPEVTAVDPLRFNVLEDNVLTIPVTGAGAADLLNQFVVGPANEADGTLGGNQSLRLVDFGSRRTAHGFVQTVLDSNGVVAALQYRPDVDYNSGPTLAVTDRIFFTVADDGTTYNLSTSALDPDPLTADFEIELVIEPVNDKPLFTTLTRTVRRLEDVGSVSIPGFATNIAAGPVTAGDERHPVTGQTLRFEVLPAPGFTQAQVDQLFVVAPAITPNGTFTYTSAPDAVGTVQMVVTLIDSGDENPVRGDVRRSDPITITVSLEPVNDAPIANPPAVSYVLDEDRSIDIPLTNTSGTGLYDIFSVGPANEGPGTTPGGNQTFATDPSLYPSTTVGGGRIEPYFVAGTLAGLRYTPALDFNGTDTFVYGVRDNGRSYSLASQSLFNDPRESFATVSLTVNAVNDRPQFGGGVDVTVNEDAGSNDPSVAPGDVGLSRIENWVTNILAGPPTALDEISGDDAQELTFQINFISGDHPATLFTTGGFPSVDPLTGQLRFQTIANANGRSVFEVIAIDDGLVGPVSDAPGAPVHQNQSVPRTFAINVQAVNDAPTFTPGAEVRIDEDNGPYNFTWATNISPGPADEVAAGQAVVFDVTTAVADRAKFAVLPTVSDNGILRFTPADNANGVIVVEVTARDTAGAVAFPGVSLTINIRPVNDAPIPLPVQLSSSEDNVLVINSDTFLVGEIDVDLPDDVLTIATAVGPSLLGATVTLASDGSTVTYDPSNATAVQALREGQMITDVFTYQVKDSAGIISIPATVTINLTGVNDVPVAVNDSIPVSLGGSTTFSPIVNDTDVDGTINPASLLVTLQPAFGSLSVNSTTGVMTYTPFEQFQGSDLIRYVVRDDTGAVSNQASIFINVNDSPFAGDDAFFTYRNEAITFEPLSNDSDPDGTLDPASLEVLTEPTNGSIVINDNGTITYQPDTDFFGDDSLTYRVRDNSGLSSNLATVSIRVIPSRLQNPRNALDVNDSGQVSPIDALLIINHLNRGGSVNIQPLLPGPPFLDVDGNLRVTPLDALRVINSLNRTGSSGGEGEGPMTATPSALGNSVHWVGFGSWIPEEALTHACAPEASSSATSAQWNWEAMADEDGALIDDVIDDLVVAGPIEGVEFDSVWADFDEFE